MSLEVTIPDEILNMDPSELSQPKPAENDAKADGGQRPSRPPAKNSGSKVCQSLHMVEKLGCLADH